jgi:hypothetical protein
VLSSGKSGTSVLPSPSGTFMAILLGSGKLAVRELSTGEDLFCAGPFVKKCVAPYSLTLQLNGNLVFSGKNALFLWSSQTGCVSAAPPAPAPRPPPALPCCWPTGTAP